MKALLFATLLALFSFIALSQAYTPTDNGSKVRFVIKNFGINTGGTFEGVNRTINFDSDNLSTASFGVSVDVKTVDTDIKAGTIL